MKDISHADRQSIEQLHRMDVEASKSGDLKRLRGLMDEDCILSPPDGLPTSGQACLDQMMSSADSKSDLSKVLELEQIWSELQIFEQLAYESGIVRYTIELENGNTIKEEQDLKRILRRQPNGEWLVLRATWTEPKTLQG